MKWAAQRSRVLGSACLVGVAAGEGVYAVMALLAWGALAFGGEDAAAAHHFGSEAMVGEGGFLYRSRFLYECGALAAGCVGITGAGLAAYAALKHRRNLYPAVVAVVGLQVGAEWLLRS